MKKSVLLSLFLSTLFLPQQRMFSMEKIIGTFFALGEYCQDLFRNNSFKDKIIDPIKNIISPTDIFGAIRSNNIARVKKLVKKNKNVLHKKNRYGDTPLHRAAFFGCDDLFLWLLENGAYEHINTKNRFGYTPLHCAAIMGNDYISHDVNWGLNICQRYKIIATLLIQYGAKVNETNKHGETPLHIAARKGRKKMAKLLLKYGANINARDNEGNTPLHIAATSYDFRKEIIEFLIKKGANINAKNDLGYTPVHRAADDAAQFKKYIPAVIQLLQHGADINIKNNEIKNKEGNTPLHTAVLLAGSEEHAFTIIKLLVENPNININAENVCGCTPLKLARELNIAQEIIDYLIEHGAQENKNIFEAVETNDIERVTTLVKKNKTVVNKKAISGRTPLHFASLHGYVYLVAYLIEHGAHIDAKTKQGHTPLALAADRECNKRARPKAFTFLRRSTRYPFLYAPFINYKKIAKLLLQYGAHVDFDLKKTDNAYYYLAVTKFFYNWKNKLHFIKRLTNKNESSVYRKKFPYIIKRIFLTSVKEMMRQRKDAQDTLFATFYHNAKSTLNKPYLQAIKEVFDVEVPLNSKYGAQEYIEKVMKKNDFCIKKRFNEHTMQMKLLSSQEKGEFADLIIIH
ncbi:ankyrin repeat domain-containing protein [Candidatus Dependentiae bacterium]